MVDKSDLNGIARALEILLGRPEHARRLAANGYNKVIEYYNAPGLASQLNAVIKQVLS
jgi:spore maturation protein CgeB